MAEMGSATCWEDQGIYRVLPFALKLALTLLGQVQKVLALLIDLVPQEWMSCWMTRGGNGI